MKLFRSISKRWRNLKNGKDKDLCLSLSVEAQSYVGAVPAMPEGDAGHRATVDAFFEIVNAKKPQIFCDIGANQGEAGRRALSTDMRMLVFGFEANPTIHKMHANVNIDAGVNWVNLAISNRTGEINLYIPRILERAYSNGKLSKRVTIEAENTGKSSILRRAENSEYNVVNVPTETLDNYLRRHAPNGRVALWIDVEGAASAVLGGAMETLDRTDVLIVEVEGFSFWQDQALVTSIIDILRRKGFIPVLRDREYGDAQFNIVFVREDAKLQSVAARISQLTTPTVLKSGVNNASPSKRDTPLFIPSFNNTSYCASMLKQAIALGFEDITFVDNASDVPEMQRFLDEAEVLGAKVERLRHNIGPRESIFTDERLSNLPRYFCVTDPDLKFNPALPPDFLEIMAEAIAKVKLGKIGFALDISNRPGMKLEKFEIEKDRHYHIWEWEQQFWAKRLEFTTGGDAIYEASVDTTFALYDRDRFVPKRLLEALRIGGRFTAIHLPWLDLNSLPTDEEMHYRATQKHSYYLM